MAITGSFRWIPGRDSRIVAGVRPVDTVNFCPGIDQAVQFDPAVWGHLIFLIEKGVIIPETKRKYSFWPFSWRSTELDDQCDPNSDQGIQYTVKYKEKRTCVCHMHDRYT